MVASTLCCGAASVLLSQLMAAQFVSAATPDSLTPEAAIEDAGTAVEDAGTAIATIVDVAADSDTFNTLVQAVQTAELAEALSAEGPFTVFAPTDDAFAALPEGVVTALLEPENRDLLVDILTYHVVAGEVPSTEVAPGPVATLSEDELVLATGEAVTVNGAPVIVPDIQASNGIIHAIDVILVPESAVAGVEALLQSTQVETQIEEVEPVQPEVLEPPLSEEIEPITEPVP
ncbi:MAG: fasciclin domain-containing protein [Cyanobacteria bacterium P01_A01_bin.135]